MQLRCRNLVTGLAGINVSQLHFELALIGYPAVGNEVTCNTLNPGTERAVKGSGLSRHSTPAGFYGKGGVSCRPTHVWVLDIT